MYVYIYSIIITNIITIIIIIIILLLLLLLGNIIIIISIPYSKWKLLASFGIQDDQISDSKPASTEDSWRLKQGMEGTNKSQLKEDWLNYPPKENIKTDMKRNLRTILNPCEEHVLVRSVNMPLFRFWCNGVNAINTIHPIHQTWWSIIPNRGELLCDMARCYWNTCMFFCLTCRIYTLIYI